MRHFVLLVCFFFSAVGANPQTITTVAGGGPNNVPALSVGIGGPRGVVVDNMGNIYVSASANEGSANRVYKIDSSGQLTIFAGNGGVGPFPGPLVPAATSAVRGPLGLAMDGSGKLYLSDSFSTIRRIDPLTGNMTLVAGIGTCGFSGDGGSATAACLNTPGGLAFDAGGNLYIADLSNHRIRRVDAGTGIITTFAGNGIPGFSGDGGPATAASLFYPWDIAFDSAGNLYIADEANHRVRRVAGGTITTVAGTGSPGFSGDGGPAASATLQHPVSVVFDTAGNLFILDRSNRRVRRVDGSTGNISTIAGTGVCGSSGDGGPATAATICDGRYLRFSPGGDLLIADMNNGRLRRVAAGSGLISTAAGNGSFNFSGDGGQATAASLGTPFGVALDAAGNLYVGDWLNRRVRRVQAASGVITTVAGGGTGGAGGPATSANLEHVLGVAVDSAGNIFIAEYNRIRRVDAATGIITTFAGGGPNSPGDGGLATSANLGVPFGVAVDSAGNVYFTDYYYHRVHKVTVGGIIYTVAGDGTPGFSGDGGPASAARLDRPWNVAADSAGNVYIADTNNHRIRRVSAATGFISTYAGNGSASTCGDGGTAVLACLNQPSGVALDALGNLFITDGTRLVRRVDAASGIITTVSGQGDWGFTGDGGPAASALLAAPLSIAVDASGNLFIADSHNHRIRRITKLDNSGPIASNVAASPNPVAVGTGSTLTARVDDTTTGGSKIASAEYNIDNGAFVSMNAVSAPFDAVAEDVTASLAAFASAGLHTVCIRGRDAANNVGPVECMLLVVYDPAGGFVTGGGAVNSPSGADSTNPSATGPAVFGFNSKYLPGNNTPSGNLEFQFKAGNLNFKSTSMDWLVVTGEPRAKFRGDGTINGQTACKFEVDAWDGSAQPGNADAFGLKIFSCAAGGDRYSLPATPLSRGSIIIHTQ